MNSNLKIHKHIIRVTITFLERKYSETNLREIFKGDFVLLTKGSF